jgi:hypothetical protein
MVVRRPQFPSPLSTGSPTPSTPEPHELHVEGFDAEALNATQSR